MAKLVEQMLELHRGLAAAKTPPEVLAHGHHSLERQITANETFRSGTIDQLVYDLHGLTKDEIKIVEGTR